MATKKNTKAAKKETKASFKEFKISGDTFDYSGRIYASRDGSGKILRSWGMSLTLNEVLTIKGVRLVETESNVFLSFPQYEDKEKKFVSYIFIDKSMNEELDFVVNKLMGIVGIADDDDQIASHDGKDLPF